MVLSICCECSGSAEVTRLIQRITVQIRGSANRLPAESHSQRSRRRYRLCCITRWWNSGCIVIRYVILRIQSSTAHASLAAFYFNKVYMKKHRARKGKMVPPEERLKPLMLAAPLFALSFFWFGLTGNYVSINIAAPILAIVLLGFCVLFLFLSVRPPISLIQTPADSILVDLQLPDRQLLGFGS